MNVDVKVSLEAAISSKSEVGLVYTDSKGVTTNRIVRPDEFETVPSGELLVAFDKEKNEYRKFSVSGIDLVTIL